MPNTLKDNQSNIICGLGTYTHTVVVAGMFFVSATCLENPPSGVSIVIQLNGTPIATSTAPAASQEAINIQTLLTCNVNDVISVVISSSSAIDNQLNTVKTLVVCSRSH